MLSTTQSSYREMLFSVSPNLQYMLQSQVHFTVLDNIETWSTTRRVLGRWLREIVKVRLDMNNIKNRTFNKSIKR